MNQLLPLIEIGAPAAAATGGALYARERAPRLYWSIVGLPAALYRIRQDWAETMEACDLTVDPPMWRVMAARRGEGQIQPVPPRVIGVRPSTLGVRVRLRLARGLSTSDVIDAVPALRHAWRVHSVHATEVRPGVVDLHIMGFDVLARPVLPSRVAGASELLNVPVAMNDRGQTFRRNFRAVPHGLTLGATQSGKSMLGRNLVHGLAPQPVALAGIDCKRGVEQGPFAPRLSALATGPDAALDLLRVLVDDVMAGRYDLIRDQLGISGRVDDRDITVDVWGLPEDVRPVPIVLLVDEIADLFLAATKTEEVRRGEIVTLLVRFGQLARAAGMYLEVMGQRFGSDLGKGATALRAQLTHRIVHRVNDIETARMGLGDISEQAMYAATRIPADLPGMAVAGDSSGSWQRIRSPYRPLSETAALCARTAHLVPDLPVLDPFRPVPPAPVDGPEDDVSIYVTADA